MLLCFEKNFVNICKNFKILLKNLKGFLKIEFSVAIEAHC